MLTGCTETFNWWCACSVIHHLVIRIFFGTFNLYEYARVVVQKIHMNISTSLLLSLPAVLVIGDFDV